MKKRIKPKIKETESTTFNQVLEEEEWYQKSFEKEDYPKETLNVSEWNECTFKDISFENSNLKDISILDCKFEHCDFSNVDFSSRAFYRVEFKSCKLFLVYIIHMYKHTTTELSLMLL